MYTYVMNPRIKEKVMTFFKAKYARIARLANLRDNKRNEILEERESLEYSSSYDFKKDVLLEKEAEKEGYRLPALN
jgi:hypothetical protein